MFSFSSSRSTTFLLTTMFFLPTVANSQALLAKKKLAPKKKPQKCFRDPGIVQIVKATTLDGIDTFFPETILGGSNNGNGPAADPNGHRRINWDGAAVPFDMPADFFAKGTLDRGLLLQSKKNQFLVSNPIGAPHNGDDKFSSIDHKASKDFTTFSSPRLFTSRQSRITLKFRVPGTAKKGLISGLGIVFVDVDKKKRTRMTFYDKYGCVLADEFAEPNNKGLSFLGIKIPEKKVASVRIIAGTGNIASRGKDVVVMDDFFYDEPTAAY